MCTFVSLQDNWLITSSFCEPYNSSKLSAMCDIFQELPDHQLLALKDLFTEHWPYAMHTYYWIDNYIEWKKKNITDVRFYCPDGLCYDGTFIAIEEEIGHCVFVFSLEKDCSRLRDALSKTTRIKWNQENLKIHFRAVHENQVPVIMAELSERGVTVESQVHTKLWWISKEEAISYQYDIPTEMYLAPLKEEDVGVIEPVWPHRSDFSKSFLTSLITVNGGFGLYSKSDGTLCSWVIKNNYGGMGMLQTVEAHKRKGYGCILAKYFSKHWAEKGLDIFCFIVNDNTASVNLFKKLGYKEAHGVSWIHCITK